MVKVILGIFIDKLIGIVKEAISDYFALKKKEKEDKKEVLNVIKIKDPKLRANAIRNLLQ